MTAGGRDRHKAARATQLAADDKKRWIDQVALGPDGAVAWSAGKTAHVITGKGEARSLEAPSTVAGLAFAPKGFRLALAHYNGVTLWFPNAAGAQPEMLEWKGSHLGVTFSPDGNFLVTTMQEPTLHGWRLADAKHMRMSGYSARVRSLSLDRGRRIPRHLGLRAAHPLAVRRQGRADGQAAEAAGAVAGARRRRRLPSAPAGGGGGLCRRRRGAGAHRRRRADRGASAKGASPVTALGWDGNGQTLAFGTEAGEAGALSF